jgi:putative endonuclease
MVNQIAGRRLVVKMRDAYHGLMLASNSARSHFAGLVAEESAARSYMADGGRVRAVRWRCPEGEIDLVVELPSEIVFVEVKARRGHADHAAKAVSARQWARVGAAATRYLAEHTDGTTPCRFDLALVDGAGRLQRIENARSFDDW